MTDTHISMCVYIYICVWVFIYTHACGIVVGFGVIAPPFSKLPMSIWHSHRSPSDLQWFKRQISAVLACVQDSAASRGLSTAKTCQGPTRCFPAKSGPATLSGRNPKGLPNRNLKNGQGNPQQREVPHEFLIVTFFAPVAFWGVRFWRPFLSLSFHRN